jgi:hypothetical protein
MKARTTGIAIQIDAVATRVGMSAKRFIVGSFSRAAPG